MISNYDYSIEMSRDNREVLKVIKEDKSIYIGSKYDVKRDVDKFLSSADGIKNDNDVFVVYGFGSGEHIKELRKKYNNQILIYEPNRKVYKYALSLDYINKDNKIELMCCSREELKRKILKYINEFNFKNSEYISFANYNNVYRDEHKEFYAAVNEVVVRLALDVNTKKHFGETWFYNVIKSIKYMVNSTLADVYNNKFKNKPAVIVSAGPSLDKNIDLLKGSEEELLIFAGGRTLPTMIDKGIKSDIFVIADSTERNYSLVKDYLDYTDVPMLFSESTNLNILSHHKGNKIFYTYDKLIKKIVGKEMKYISTGGSVAHAMLSYAANIGCNPVILIGQDFAYTDRKAHADIAENKDGSYNYDIAVKEDDVYIDDIYGQKVRTSIVLNNQRIAMEQIIGLYKNTTFINATEGGANIKGTKIMKLKEALKKYKKGKFAKFNIVQVDKSMINNAIVQLEKLKNVVDNICLKVNTDNIEQSYENIIDLYNNNETYSLLLYSAIYDYFTCNKEHRENMRKQLVFKCERLIKDSVRIIEEELDTLKKIEK